MVYQLENLASVRILRVNIRPCLPFGPLRGLGSLNSTFGSNKSALEDEGDTFGYRWFLER